MALGSGSTRGVCRGGKSTADPHLFKYDYYYYDFFSILFHFPFYSDIAEIALWSG